MGSSQLEENSMGTNQASLWLCASMLSFENIMNQTKYIQYNTEMKIQEWNLGTWVLHTL